MQSFIQKQKNFKVRTKNTFFGYFWATILKNYCHIWNRHPQICEFAKFCKKTMMSKFGTKNALFETFGLDFLKNIFIFEISTFEFV